MGRATKMSADIAFNDIATAMKISEAERSDATARKAAERHGLMPQPATPLSQRHSWERIIGDTTIWFESRWHDPSQAFSIQPDVRILTVEIRGGGRVLRREEVRFPD
jgi:hypothetical protein